MIATNLQSGSALFRRHSLAGIFIALVLLALAVQAVHVHQPTASTDATCLICISAHTGAPVAVLTTLVMLTVIASLPMMRLFQAAKVDCTLPLFIRPPPAA